MDRMTSQRSQKESRPTRRRAALTRAWILTLVLVAVASGAAWLLHGHALALGVALGALFGMLNITALDWILTSLISRAQREKPSSRGWSIPALLLLKWPVVLLALAGVLWYIPARPEGLAAGLILSLVAAVIAGRTIANDSDS